MRLKVLSMNGYLLDTECQSIRVPSVEGLLGIHTGHAPMMCALDCGNLEYKIQGENKVYAIPGGIFEVHDDCAIVLIN